LAKNTGEGHGRGQESDRYQQRNEPTDRYDKYDGDGNHVSSKSTPGPARGLRSANRGRRLEVRRRLSPIRTGDHQVGLEHYFRSVQRRRLA